MKKTEYDTLTKIQDILKNVSERVTQVSRTVQNLADEVEHKVTSEVEGLLTEVNRRLEASPLEDPVVPTGWASSTDNVDGLTRQQKEDYILASATKVGNEHFSKPEYVRGLDDRTLDTVYKVVVGTEKVAAEIAKRLKDK